MYTDIWDAHDAGHWIGICTNGMTKPDPKGSRFREEPARVAIMGAGIAKQAATKYPILPFKLAQRLEEFGNHVFLFPEVGIFTFPTKENWFNDSPLSLIRQSAIELSDLLRYDQLFQAPYGNKPVFLPPPGCGHGGLTRARVEPVLNEIFEPAGVKDRVIVLWKD